MHQGLFITGTDTEVGKTFVGAGLVNALYQQNIDVQPRKPAESACTQNKDGLLLPADGKLYFDAVEQSIELNIITPYRFKSITSTRQAARLEQQTITIELLRDAVLHRVQKNSFLLVEGAGGFYSPLTEDGLNADLAQKLGLPVMLVAANRLGCINHTLLTIEAIEQRQLTLACIVLNDLKNNNDESMQNADELRRHTKIPVFCTPNAERREMLSPQYLLEITTAVTHKRY